MKKRTVALLLALMLVFGCAVGGTVAWLSSKTDAVINTFTTGQVKITLDETDVDEDNNTNDNKTYGEGDDATVRDKANTYKLMPGSTYVKDPIIHVDGSSEKAYVYVGVYNGISDIEADDVDGETATTIAGQMAANGWVALKEGDTQVTAEVDGVTYSIWYKADPVDGGAEVKVFESITIADNAELAEFNDTVKIIAFAIQSENTGDAVAAWTSGQSDWGLTT